MAETESLTVRIERPIKQNLSDLAKLTDRSMSYHAERALAEYVRREKGRMENLSREIETGIASLGAGKGIRMSASLFDDIKQRGRERLAELDSKR
ncbi:MAG: ribbon-helix-helix protein, CopG family [Gammaproteobacteria bacterium]|nr:ribbon-helix-helix protein, CopG family [Gammaproteobacteria bacterium]MBU1656055.1 ribbon-helix-helix protein, CopG family [Gammaproteobacteria bacterium]MBU1961244.1 ribbon-helix-helix protein, CopG family [Gammaproteobacteria bacterium]